MLINRCFASEAKEEFIMRPALLISFALLLATACTGLTLGENKPGGSTNLEYGSIAVDPRSEVSYVLETKKKGQVTTKTLYSIHPDAGNPIPVATMTGYSDIRIVFPKNHVLVMAEKNGVDSLMLLDPDTMSLVETLETPGRYNGIRVSPSGRFLAAADNNHPNAPIHIIDTQTWDILEIPHDGQWLEAMWLNGTDELVAIVFYEGAGANPHARLLSWSMETVADAGFAVAEGGLWADPILDSQADGVVMDMLFSFTWVGISPDDSTAVFPVRVIQEDGEVRYMLIVMDVLSGQIRFVDDARGPVGFTPDSTTIVSYRYVGKDQAPQLVLIDPDTLEEEPMELPMVSGPQYFVSHEGNFIVVASQFGNENLVLYDVDNSTMETVAGPAVGLNEFVSRPGQGELWLVDQGLFRLDLFTNQLDAQPLTFTPKRINILPMRDQIVLDDRSSNEIRFVDLTTLEVIRQVTLGF